MGSDTVLPIIHVDFAPPSACWHQYLPQYYLFIQLHV